MLKNNSPCRKVKEGMNIFGIDIDCISYEDMYPIFDRWLADKSTPSHTLALANVYTMVTALLDQRVRHIFDSADLVGIDGMPFLHWARLFYNKKADRFYAPDLLLEISSKAKKKGYTFYLYGGYPGAPEKIEAFLKERFEGIQIVGKYSPPFRTLTDTEEQAICDQINQLKPDFIWVGLGTPKQDLWIHEHREKIQGAIMIPAGATFDFFSGRIKQAPKWIRNVGLEWLYRLTQDFRRLFVRYTLYNAIFLIVFSLQLLRIIKFKK
jgi:N-acetylglucosaminyldiphosphoundecaprenol N-acetyl-beta-D-mannosaminyltransferase